MKKKQKQKQIQTFLSKTSEWNTQIITKLAKYSIQILQFGVAIIHRIHLCQPVQYFKVVAKTWSIGMVQNESAECNFIV